MLSRYSAVNSSAFRRRRGPDGLATSASFAVTLAHRSPGAGATEPRSVQLPTLNRSSRFLENTAAQSAHRKQQPARRTGTSYQQLLSALLLAGVRQYQAPAGRFSFHAGAGN